MIKHIFFFCLLGLYAQTGKCQYPVNRILLDSPQVTYTFYVTDLKPQVKAGYWYCWYKSGRLHATQEGYDGRLLNGEFRKMYAGKGLCELGWYVKGVKSGEWKLWFENGLLMEKALWKNGQRSGDVQRFDSTGKIIQKGIYKKGLFSGQVYDHAAADSVRVLYFKKGKLSGEASEVVAGSTEVL